MAAPITNPYAPAPLLTDSGEVFDAKAFEFAASLEPRRQELQAQAEWIDTRANAVEQEIQDAIQPAANAAAYLATQQAAQSASDALNYSDNAATYSQNAEVSASQARGSAINANDAKVAAQAAANMVGEWSAQSGAKNPPLSVSYQGSIYALNSPTSDITADKPGVSSKWTKTAPTSDAIMRTVEAMGGGRVTVRYTDKGQPCYFYRLPKYNLEDLPGWDSADGTGVHPAFIQNGVEKGYILIGMYQAAEIAGEAVSQPYMTPKVSINFDNARALCQAAGAGFDIMSVWDWSAIAMWCMANGFQPRGNSDYGRSHANKWETGRLVDGTLDLGAPDAFGKATLTGSGPNHWRHDDSMFGIADLVGNVWEWNAGFKLVGGVAHIAPDNGIYTEEQYLDTGFSPAIANPWSNTSSAGAPAILKQALIVPSAAQSPVGYGSSVVDGERLPLRGGYRAYGGDVGLGALNLSNERTNTRSSLGFRPIFRT